MSIGGVLMDSVQLILELIKVTDLKIDLMEYCIEKLDKYSDAEKMAFIGASNVFNKIDWLNIEFLSNYEKLLRKEGIKDISQLKVGKFESLVDLKHLVEYAFDLEVELDSILKKLL